MESGFEKIKFVHVRTVNGGAITVAVCEENIFRNPIPEGHVAIGVAFCNPKDQFSRAVGRRVAVRKMSKAANIVPKNLIYNDDSYCLTFSPEKAFREALCQHWPVYIPYWLLEEAGEREPEHHAQLLWTAYRCGRKRRDLYEVRCSMVAAFGTSSCHLKRALDSSEMRRALDSAEKEPEQESPKR